jgi:undecaprenyl-diphosphatase
MLSFDISVLHFLNGYVGASSRFDRSMVYLTGPSLLKLTPMILVLCGFWFTRQGNVTQIRKSILQGIVGCAIAMFLARGLALLLPFRVRPLLNPQLEVHIPDTLSRGVLDGWSSLPSDHAALAFAMATVILLIHRAWGIFAFLHAAIIICLPRAYLGLHYSTDLLVGALVGISSSYFSMRIIGGTRIANLCLDLENTRPAFFYVAALLLASQMMQMFDGIRGLASIAASVLFKLP